MDAAGTGATRRQTGGDSGATLVVPEPAFIEGLIALFDSTAAGVDARRVLGDRQRAGLRGAALLLMAVFLVVPKAVLIALSLVTSVAFLALGIVRLLASAAPDRAALPKRALADDVLPVYTVLVPLRREARVVPRLVANLGALAYPPDKLDIKMLVEADDPETASALARHAGALAAEIVILPPVGPMTKPKALDAGLALARGDLITVFDAEDRPEPDQLRVSAETFAAGSDDLACLQARLVIDHPEEGWFPTMFAIEYAMLFDGLLPWLARGGYPFLLGGTSNHFRRSALLAVGGWDPWNVTEDADLALRLAAAGCRSGLIASATFEEAPLALRPWLRQRTRWLKGWLQTWFVHMRHPATLLRLVGPGAFSMIQLQLLASLGAIAAHPVWAVLVAAALMGLAPLGTDGSVTGDLVMVFSASAFAIGWLAAARLAVTALERRRFVRGRRALVWLPLYWLLMSWALGLAVIDLVRRPHFWAKTAHGLARRPSGTLQERRSATKRAAAASVSAAAP
ncbi:glycosyltransferase family 2 protein [Segnochrobactrum spirostomi]|uniref:Glycosyltransferase n=1 Tax=Segnochrobactrum spirostomi TaxID=2608987 RepID=A0A6A7Y5C3_9HYPH|nr:glycosyltransferase family 2 protein [Segnochrobactrum spirostomi]MQT13547.1 glycosyltransferase [Segnochrobactrum spirostomi]